jgi:hypothetical protein
MKRAGLIILLIAALGLKAQPPQKFHLRWGGNGIDIGYSVIQTLDGQYIVVGSTSSYGAGNTDIYMAKIDSMGNMIWTKTFGGFSNDVGRGVIQLADSSFVISGFTNSYGNGGYDALVIKADKAGNQQWLRTWGGSDWDFGYDIIQTGDGNVVICGSTISFGKGKYDGFVSKYDPAGNIIWQKFYGGGEDDEFMGLTTKNGTEIYVGGITKSYGETNGDMLMFKLDNSGDSLMRIIYGGAQYDICNDVAINKNNEIILGGGSNSYTSGMEDALVVKFTSAGNFVVMKKYGEANGDEEIFKVIPSNSSFGEEIIIYSSNQNLGTKRDFLTLAIDQNLDFIYGGQNGSFGYSEDEEPRDICRTKDKGYAQIGWTNSLGAVDKDFLFVKRDSMMAYGVLTGVEELKSEKRTVACFPNPAKDKIYFDYKSQNNVFLIKIFDISGQLVSEKKIQAGNERYVVDIEDLGAGIYMVELTDREQKFHFKLTKL